MLQAAIPEFALSDLESAERAGVIEVANDRLRFTTAPRIDPLREHSVSRRRELHRRLATVIDDEVEHAQHLALGAEAPDRDLADNLERAAVVAERRGAIESAAQLLDDAARLTPIDQSDARNARIVASAEHRLTSGEVSRARDMLSEVMPHLAAGPLRARARLQLAELSGDEPQAAIELLEAALSDAEADDRVRVQIEWELTFAAGAIGRLADAKGYAESALRSAERLGDPELIARALGELLLTAVTTGEPLREDVLERLSTFEDVSTIAAYYQPGTSIALARNWAGDFEAHGPGSNERPSWRLPVARSGTE